MAVVCSAVEVEGGERGTPRERVRRSARRVKMVKRWVLLIRESILIRIVVVLLRALTEDESR
jgi:hypothetical protein